MIVVKNKQALESVTNPIIQMAISNTIHRIETDYQEDYQATLHGWFVILEHTNELNEPVAGLPFSIAEKLKNGEIEYVDKQAYAYEVYFTLNDTEGVLVYIPHQLYPET